LLSKLIKNEVFAEFLMKKNIFSHPGTLVSEGEQNSLDKVELKTDENRQQQNQKPDQQKQKLQQEINESLILIINLNR